MPGTGPRSTLSSLVQSSLIPFAAALLFASAALAGPGHGQNAAPPSEAAQAKAADARVLSTRLVELSIEINGATRSQEANIRAAMVQAAERRRTLLSELLTESPGEVLRSALPPHLSDSLPSEARDLVETTLEIEGELEVLHIDLDDGNHSELRYFLQSDEGERLSLHFAGRLPGLPSGTRVRAAGAVLFGVNVDGFDDSDGAMAIGSEDSSVERLVLQQGGTSGGSSGTVLEAPMVTTNTTGEQRLAVIMVNFQDNTDQPYTKQQMADSVSGWANDYISEMSYGRTWLNGDVFGWYTMPINGSVCSFSDIITHGEQAALNHGVPLSNYDRYVFVLGGGTGCNWGGVGTVGGNPSKAVLNILGTMVHELGHNFGLFHSNALECGAETLSDSCSVVEYGDPADQMGGGAGGHFNAYQKDRLGWLNDGSAPPITVVDTSGTYTIAPFETADSQPKALKILKSVDPATGEETYYYVEFRQPIGIDADMSKYSGGNLHDGGLVHTGADLDANTSWLLDMTPNATFVDSALEVGNSYDDVYAGVTITTQTLTSSGLSLAVSLGAQVCKRGNPMIELSPIGVQYIGQGTPITYAVTVTNRDNAACSQSSFNLSSTAPSSWSEVLSASRITLAPGVAQTVTLELTAPLSASDGLYSIDVKTENAADKTFAATTLANIYLLNGLSNTPPVAQNDNATTDQDTAVTIPVLANDSDSDGDALSVASVNKGAKGNATKNANGTVTYTPNAGASGSDSFSYTISDGKGGSDTATVALTINSIVGNLPPVAQNDSGATDEDVAVSIDVLANDSDPDGDTLSVASVSQGAGGAVKVNANGSVTYTPSPGFSGSDSFGYTVDDGNGGSANATVSVTVTAAPNKPPVANNDSATTGENTSVTVAVLANDSDPDGDPLSVASASDGLAGKTVVNGDGSVTYTPDAGFSGSDSFVYTVSDGNGGSASAGVSVTVTAAPNQAPLAANDNATTDEAKPVIIPVLANDSDPDGDALSVGSIVQGAGGFASANGDGTVTYAPMTGFTGTDSFGYTVSDGRGGTDSATVAVTVNDVNLAPVALDDSATVLAGASVTIDVLANDSDPDGDALSVAGASNGAKGTVTVNADGTITYTHTPDANGKRKAKAKGDSLSYTVVDAMGNSASATVSIKVESPKGGGNGGGNGKGKPGS